MKDGPKRNKLPKLDDLMAISARLEAARANDPAMHQSDAGEVLRMMPGKRAVLRGKFNGRDAVFRVYLNAEDPIPHREWKELNRAWQFMNKGNYLVSEPLHHSEAHGIIVQTYARGRTLQNTWQRKKSTTPKQYLKPVAEWLRSYTQPTEFWRRDEFSGWLEKAKRCAKQQSFATLERLETEILSELERLAGTFQDVKWRVAICHGDFHPGNLIVNKDKQTGIDTGGSGKMAVYKNMARFLVHMGRREMNPSGQLWLGVDLQAIEAFAQVFDLTESERVIYLPYMIGCETLIRPEQSGLSEARVKLAENMSTAMLDDLRKVGRS